MWTDDLSSATAVFAAKDDGTVVQIVTDSAVECSTVAADCVNAGKKVYTASVEFHGKTYTDTKEVEIPALGHDWGEVEYVWSEDNKTVTATRVCKNDPEHKETEKVNTTSEITKNPTPDSKGKTTYTGVFTNPAFENQTNVVDNIPKLPKATVEAVDDPKENVVISGQPTTVDQLDAEYIFTAIEPEADTKAYYGNWNCDYRVTFLNDFDKNTFGLYGAYNGYNTAFEQAFLYPANAFTNQQVYLLNSAGLAGITYNDVADNVQIFNCGVFNLSADNEGKKILVEMVIWNGDTEYVLTSTTYTFGPASTVECIHDWEFAGFTWAEAGSGYTAVANYVCKHDASHTNTVYATVDNGKITTEPTCEAAGVRTYTAAVTATDSLDKAEHSDTKEVEIPATGHDWGKPTYEWAEDNSTVTATRVCKHDATHVETETVNTTSEVTKEATYDNSTVTATRVCKNDPEHKEIETVNTTSEVTKKATCEAKGETTYTATFTNNAFEAQTRTVDNIDATGHEWGEVKYVWSEDYKTVTAKRVCKHDATHVETETVETVSEITRQATSELWGQTTYTAEFKNEAFETQTVTLDTIPKLPKATVENVTPVKTDVTLDNGEVIHKLNAEYIFKSVDPEKATLDYYGGWNCDYRVTFGADFDKKTFGLYGAYAGYGQNFEMAFLYPNNAFSGQNVYLLNAAVPAGITYSDVANNVKIFDCGIFNLSAENIGKTITVDMVIWQGTDTSSAIVIQSVTYTFTDPADIWEFTGFTWTKTATGFTAAANYVSKTNPANTMTVDANVDNGVTTTEPTCEAAGVKTYTAAVTATVSLDKVEHSDTKEVEIPATGHDWGEVEYVWSEDCKTVTATRVCKHDATHVETETVNTTSEITKPATCEAKGETTYTATFTNNAFETQTKTVENIDTTGHDWAAPTYTWAEDNSTVTARRVCKHDATHVETETVNTTSEVTKEATCEANGETTYTATFTNAAFETQTKTVENIDATGHDWAAPTYEWADDNSTVTATRTCKNDPEHKETETVNTTSAVTKAATCEAKGKTTYTATFTNNAFETQTKTVENIDATGHDWAAPTYTWAEDNSTVTATRVCKNDPEHKETETVNTTSKITKDPTGDEKGETTYTGVFENEAFGEATKAVDNIPKLPKATVEPVPASENVVITDTHESVDKLDAEFRFTAVTPDAETKAYYGDWECDYRVKFLNDFDKNTFGLYGAYNGYGQNFVMAFRYPNNAFNGQNVYLLNAAGLTGITYGDVADNVKIFNCGVFNLSADNEGKKIVVEMIIRRGETEYVLTSTEYTFGSASTVECIHDWEFAGFTWTETEDGYTAVANYVCKHDASHRRSTTARPRPNRPAKPQASKPTPQP